MGAHIAQLSVGDLHVVGAHLHHQIVGAGVHRSLDHAALDLQGHRVGQRAGRSRVRVHAVLIDQAVLQVTRRIARARQTGAGGQVHRGALEIRSVDQRVVVAVVVRAALSEDVLRRHHIRRAAADGQVQERPRDRPGRRRAAGEGADSVVEARVVLRQQQHGGRGHGQASRRAVLLVGVHVRLNCLRQLVRQECRPHLLAAEERVRVCVHRRLGGPVHVVGERAFHRDDNVRAGVLVGLFQLVVGLRHPVGVLLGAAGAVEQVDRRGVFLALAVFIGGVEDRHRDVALHGLGVHGDCLVVPGVAVASEDAHPRLVLAVVGLRGLTQRANVRVIFRLVFFGGGLHDRCGRARACACRRRIRLRRRRRRRLSRGLRYDLRLLRRGCAGGCARGRGGGFAGGRGLKRGLHRRRRRGQGGDRLVGVALREVLDGGNGACGDKGGGAQGHRRASELHSESLTFIQGRNKMLCNILPDGHVRYAA